MSGMRGRARKIGRVHHRINERKMTTSGFRTVLIIDDEPVDREQFRRTLVRSGLAGNTVQFSDADVALDWVQRNPDTQIDLVLLDVNMPRMTGLEFLARADDRLCALGAVVAIMLTAPLMSADRATAHSFGSVRAFFDKPLTTAHLESVARLIPTRRT